MSKLRFVFLVSAAGILAAIVTLVSPAIVRTKTIDTCHVYDQAGFPLSFIETIETQPSNDQCLSFALSKSHPTYNVQNMAIDWLAYFTLAAGALAIIRHKKRRSQPPVPQ